MATTTSTITALNGSVILNYANDPAVLVGVSGTYSGVTLAFATSPDQSNWTGWLGATPGPANTVSAYPLLDNETRFFDFNGTRDNTYFLVLASAFGSGTVTVTITSYDPFVPSNAITTDSGDPIVLDDGSTYVTTG